MTDDEIDATQMAHPKGNNPTATGAKTLAVGHVRVVTNWTGISWGVPFLKTLCTPTRLTDCAFVLQTEPIEIEGSTRAWRAHTLRQIEPILNPEPVVPPFRVHGGKDRHHLNDDCVTNGDAPLIQIPTIHRDPPGIHRDF